MGSATGKTRYSRVQLFGTVAVTALVTSAVVGGGFVLAGAGPTPNKYYACAKNNVVSGAIKVNAKPTCPAGHKLVVWNQAGAKGAKGATGATGAVGATGLTGARGPGGLASVGRFTASQLVEGGLLTCASTATDATTSRCNGMKLNGLDVGYAELVAANKVCAVVTGGGWQGTDYGPATSLRFDWDGAKWVLQTWSDQGISNLICSR